MVRSINGREGHSKIKRKRQSEIGGRGGIGRGGN